MKFKKKNHIKYHYHLYYNLFNKLYKSIKKKSDEFSHNFFLPPMKKKIKVNLSPQWTILSFFIDIGLTVYKPTSPVGPQVTHNVFFLLFPD